MESCPVIWDDTVVCENVLGDGNCGIDDDHTEPFDSITQKISLT